MPNFLNPSMANPPTEYGPSDYVGIAGVGADQPEKVNPDHKSGIFGYNRQTKFSQITDGTSNTVMTSESKEPGPWAAGGRGTVRAFTTKPYINGPDGFGGNHAGGCVMGFADGSVRFISENIDPSVMEALATMAGSEVIGDF